MTGRVFLALVLIAVHVLASVYQGFSFTTRKKVLDVGPIQAARERHHNAALPTFLGANALVGGIIVLVSGRRTS